MCGVVVLAVPASGSADEAISAGPGGFASKTRLMGNLGIGSAVGEMGGTFTYAATPHSQIEMGAGIGYTGFQLSVMPKLSVGSRSHRFVLGMGPSVGIDPANNPDHTYVSYWLNSEVGYEYRSASGFSFLIAAGLTYGLGGEYRWQCPFDCDGDTAGYSRSPAGTRLPQGRIAFGRWF